MPTTPIPISALPAAPDRADRATFSSRAVAMFSALKDVFVGQVNAIAVTANTNAVEAASSAADAVTSANDAATSASNAAISAANAATSAGAAMWVSGTYGLGAAVWSPVNRIVYRKITASSLTSTDPSADPTNWAALGTFGLTQTNVTTTTQSAVTGNDYLLSNVAATTVTAPANGEFAVTPVNGLKTNIVDFGAATVIGPAGSTTGTVTLNLGARMHVKYSTAISTWVMQ